jgi:hypothetical protein
MAEGTLIAESLRVGTDLAGVSLSLIRIRRDQANLSPEQTRSGLPATWTSIDFETSDERAEALAAALARALAPFGWYANLQSATDSYVVFADRVFRYPRGDSRGRAEAQAHARAHGVPEAQLDWSV